MSAVWWNNLCPPTPLLLLCSYADPAYTLFTCQDRNHSGATHQKAQIANVSAQMIEEVWKTGKNPQVQHCCRSNCSSYSSAQLKLHSTKILQYKDFYKDSIIVVMSFSVQIHILQWHPNNFEGTWQDLFIRLITVHFMMSAQQRCKKQTKVSCHCNADKFCFRAQCH